MDHLIPETAVSRYTATPSDTTVQAAVSLHKNIRDTLGSEYETFLQGSYKNDTGVADINDVDIVALRKNTISGQFATTASTNRISWERIFQEVQDKLESSSYYRGKTELGDKCITVNTDFKADVVPAVYISSDGNDPIAVYSFREASERRNYPRVHYQNNVNKHGRTRDVYKSVVRMFKRWAKNWFPRTKIAPSFYIECTVYNVPDASFIPDRAVSFLRAGKHIVDSYTRNSVITSVAGDKDILTNNEWHPDNFDVFRAQLILSIGKVAQALTATSAVEAQKLWREAFNE